MEPNFEVVRFKEVNELGLIFAKEFPLWEHQNTFEFHPFLIRSKQCIET